MAGRSRPRLRPVLFLRARAGTRSRRARLSSSPRVTGYRLAELRRSRGFTKPEIAARMGVTKGRVSQIERGKISGQEVLARYAAALGGRLHQAIYFDIAAIARRPASRLLRPSGSRVRHAGPPARGVTAMLLQRRTLAARARTPTEPAAGARLRAADGGKSAFPRSAAIADVGPGDHFAGSLLQDRWPQGRPGRAGLVDDLWSRQAVNPRRLPSNPDRNPRSYAVEVRSPCPHTSSRCRSPGHCHQGP